jgi:hypothetical protein
MQTTAGIVKVTTGTSVKTMLQIATPSTRQLKIVSWGFTLDSAPATTGTGLIELIQTDVAATVTAHSASGVQPLDPNAPASLMTLSTTGTGYTSSGEGSITAVRTFDAIQISGESNGAGPVEYHYQFLPEEWSYVAVSKFLRVRVTFSAAVNMLCSVLWDE